MVDIERGIFPQGVTEGVRLVSPDRDPSKSITEKDSALRVMTDLKVVTPFQIEASALIDAANDKMMACGVRLLFVNDAQGDLVGLITSKDVLGEKPLLFVTRNGGTHHDITVKDIMTPLSKLEVIPLAQVERATVGDIVEALKDCRRHHMLVLQTQEGRNCVRGIFSITQVGRQLGVAISPSERAQGFAQLNKALS